MFRLFPRPNKFKRLPVIKPALLKPAMWMGCLVNFVGVILVSAACWLWSAQGTGSSEAAVESLPTLTVTPYPTYTPYPTLTLEPGYLVEVFPTPEPLETPGPTETPLPSPTPYPTEMPLPTPTPYFTETPLPTPTKVRYTYEQIESGAVPSNVECGPELGYCYYEAFCLPGPNRIEPRVAGLSALTGLHFELWNDYGWWAERDFTVDTTFQLSDEPSVFHLALFYYGQRLSDVVNVDYPSDCKALQIVFVQSKPQKADSVNSVTIGVSLDD